MNKKVHTIKYLILDYLSATASWTLFFIFRKLYVEPLKFGYKVPVELNEKFILGLIIVPLFWIFIYHVTGYYKQIFRKSWIEDIVFTFLQTITGVLLIFFTLILDDYVSSYKNYYQLLSVLFSLHFSMTLILRMIITLITRMQIQNRKIGFNTIILGSVKQAAAFNNESMFNKKSSGNYFVGYVSPRKKDDSECADDIPYLGSIEMLSEIVREQKVEEVIVALRPEECGEIDLIMNELAFSNVIIKLPPELYNQFSVKVKMEQLYGQPYVQLSPNLMPVWQENIKELVDIVFSLLALILLSPLMMFIAAGIKITSIGPVIYTHERMGRYGKPFKFYKFRSMKDDAESSGPELSSKNDKRLTNFGRFLRKYRLDEIPNFFNVLKGDLSLVGPRPEREYYTQQILNKAPHYIHIQRIKPGITSWGQVKYGYAENVDQMLKRLDYDIMYIWNMSLLADFRILFYTFLTIIKGRGI